MFIIKDLEKKEQAKAAIQSKQTINELVKTAKYHEVSNRFLILKKKFLSGFICLCFLLQLLMLRPNQALGHEFDPLGLQSLVYLSVIMYVSSGKIFEFSVSVSSLIK